ncbi:EamA family transporter [Sphingobacterium hungaricum]|uniref:EamA family transporter n=1 Tax=Sphingobacterium hungaricum TaxID=2082723 RepID=A0A928YNL8_9SPHI|nr:EamA family transporter [Sphingobacterium hungaricum]MBE8712196.1 EamA family transporter [Sphingobacterium hungaricum]
MRQNSTKPITSIIFAYAVVYVVWGSTFFFIEKALHSFPPFVLGSIRFVIASVLLMGYCWIKGYKLFNKAAVKQAVFVGFLLLFVDMAAIIWSEQYISSGIVSILSAATAIWFIIFDKRKWKENFSSPTIVLGLILGFIGVIMLFAEQIFTSIPEEEKSQNLIAMLVLTCGTIGWTIGSLYSKYSKKPEQKEEQEEDLNVMVKTAWQMAIAGLAFSLVASLNGEYANFQPSAVATEDWFSIIYLALFGSILAFSCYIWLLQMRPATEVSTYAYVNPIVALVLVHFFSDHYVTQMQVAGLAVVLFSVLLMNWNLYSNSKLYKNYKRKKRIKKLRYMAPKSSIPRIIEVADFGTSEKKEKQKAEGKTEVKQKEVAEADEFV